MRIHHTPGGSTAGRRRARPCPRGGAPARCSLAVHVGQVRAYDLIVLRQATENATMSLAGIRSGHMVADVDALGAGMRVDPDLTGQGQKPSCLTACPICEGTGDRRYRPRPRDVRSHERFGGHFDSLTLSAEQPEGHPAPDSPGAARRIGVTSQDWGRGAASQAPPPLVRCSPIP